MVIVSMLATGISIGLTPILKSLIACHVVSFIVGGSIGLLEIGCNCWIIAMWQQKSGTVFHFLNFCFGLGGVLAPFTAEPFLSKVHTMYDNNLF